MALTSVFKSIFTVATQPDTMESSVKAAAQLALHCDAHLDILALGVERGQLSYSYLNAGTALLQITQERAEAEARAVQSAAQTALAREERSLRARVEAAVAFNGGLTDLIAQRARFADLVVLPQPYGPGSRYETEAAVEAALFEGNAPLMVVPRGKDLSSFPPRSIVLAWNQSAESLRAIRAALALLKSAERVIVTIVDPPAHGPERSDPGGALCEMLVRHGVKAEIAVLARSQPRISDILARHIREQGADLLVMGAYGHSRFREAILGGATRDLLEEAEVPVLLAH